MKLDNGSGRNPKFCNGSKAMKILLHICCGPCSIYPVGVLRDEGHDLTGLFYNPNIQPYKEYQRREETLRAYAQSIDLPVMFHEEYTPEEHLRAVAFRESERCRFCYGLRLKAAAQAARQGGFDALATTLLYSRYQKHDLIAEIGRETCGAQGVEFLYRDFRVGWREGVDRSRELGMYRQPYCGCVYSEKDRYYRPARLLKRP